jgi:hypothetical protein
MKEDDTDSIYQHSTASRDEEGDYNKFQPQCISQYSGKFYIAKTEATGITKNQKKQEKTGSTGKKICHKNLSVANIGKYYSSQEKNDQTIWNSVGFSINDTYQDTKP